MSKIKKISFCNSSTKEPLQNVSRIITVPTGYKVESYVTTPENIGVYENSTWTVDSIPADTCYYLELTLSKVEYCPDNKPCPEIEIIASNSNITPELCKVIGIIPGTCVNGDKTIVVTKATGGIISNLDPNTHEYEFILDNNSEPGVIFYNIECRNGCAKEKEGPFTITINPCITLPEDLVDNITICPNTEYVWKNGETYTEEGTYTFQDTNSIGQCYMCTLNLSIHPEPQDKPESGQKCPNGNYISDSGVTYNTEGTFREVATGTDSNGCNCDTLVTVTNYEVLDKPESGFMCVGGSYTSVSGQTYTEIGEYREVGTGIDNNGCPCDTVVTVESYPVTEDTSETVQVCPNEEYLFNGNNYSVGEHSILMTDNNGCNYNHVLTVEEYPITEDTTETVNVCIGDTYTFNGQEYSVGMNNIPMTDNNGCPYNHILTVNEFPQTADNVTQETVCNVSGGASPTSITWRGNSYTCANVTGGVGTTTIITEVAQDANGCDYNEVLELTCIDCVVAGVCSISINSTSETTPTCDTNNQPNSDGSTTITATGSNLTGSLEYSIDNTIFQSSNIINNLAPGTYTVTVRDSGDTNCVNTANITIPTPDCTATPVCSITGLTATAVCNGANADISISFNASNTSGSYILEVNGVTSSITTTNPTYTFNNATGQVVDIVVTDSANRQCTQTINFTLPDCEIEVCDTCTEVFVLCTPDNPGNNLSVKGCGTIEKLCRACPEDEADGVAIYYTDNTGATTKDVTPFFQYSDGSLPEFPCENSDGSTPCYNHYQGDSNTAEDVFTFYDSSNNVIVSYDNSDPRSSGADDIPTVVQWYVSDFGGTYIPISSQFAEGTTFPQAAWVSANNECQYLGLSRIATVPNQPNTVTYGSGFNSTVVPVQRSVQVETRRRASNCCPNTRNIIYNIDDTVQFNTGASNAANINTWTCSDDHGIAFCPDADGDTCDENGGTVTVSSTSSNIVGTQVSINGNASVVGCESITIGFAWDANTTNPGDTWSIVLEMSNCPGNTVTVTGTFV